MQIQADLTGVNRHISLEGMESGFIYIKNTLMQLKKTAKLLTMIGLIKMHADFHILFKIKAMNLRF